MHDTIHIAGPGALGLFLASVFSYAGYGASLISRPGTAETHVVPKILRPEGDSLLSAHAPLPLRSLSHFSADAWRGSIAVLAVKARDLAPLLAQLADSFAASGSPPRAILVLSNGLGITGSLRDWKESLPRASRTAIARGTAWFGCRRESAERVRFAGPARLDFAWVDQDRVQAMTGLLSKALSPLGIDVVPEDSVERLEWRKGAWNASMNALLALADAPNGALLEHGRLRGEFEALLDEAFAVARTDGADLGDPDRNLIEDSIRRTRTNWNSFHGDLRGGRPTELPHLNQWLVARARALGIPVPRHERIVAAVAKFELERTARESASP